MPKLVISATDAANAIEEKSPLFYKDGNTLYKTLPETAADQVKFANSKNAEVVIQEINAAVSTAQSTANTANNKAETAQTTANAANAAAQAAQSTASSAAANASAAQTTASNAVSTANAANAKATSVESTADTANSNAATAVSTANTAKTTAESASSTATNALNKANEVSAALVLMTGATTTANGNQGLVPAPNAGAANRYLRSDGTWQVPPDTTYNLATTSANGLMSAADKEKLDGLTNNNGSGSGTLPDTDILPIANGGTGANTASTALSNLGGFPKTGGFVSGTIYSQSAAADTASDQANGITALSLRDKNNVQMGYVNCTHYADSSCDANLAATRINSAGNQAYSIVKACFDKDGIAYPASNSNPRTDTYGTDLVTMKALKDRASQRLPNGEAVNIHIGGTGASDTANLNAGRGLSETLPFATLMAAVKWAGASYNGLGTLAFILHANQSVSADFRFDIPNGLLGHIYSANSNSPVTITAAGGVTFTCGSWRLENVNISATGSPEHVIGVSAYHRHVNLLLTGKIGLSGAASSGVIEAAWLSQIIIAGTTMSGSPTGKRYYCQRGGRILTGGKGATYIPGTEAGIADANSFYE